MNANANSTLIVTLFTTCAYVLKTQSLPDHTLESINVPALLDGSILVVLTLIDIPGLEPFPALILTGSALGDLDAVMRARIPTVSTICTTTLIGMALAHLSANPSLPRITLHGRLIQLTKLVSRLFRCRFFKTVHART